MKLMTKSLLMAALLITGPVSQVQAEKTQGNSTEVRKQYDFLIGNWDCTYVQYVDGKEAGEYPCTWQGKYTFDGLMVQDDFRMFYQGCHGIFGYHPENLGKTQKALGFGFFGLGSRSLG